MKKLRNIATLLASIIMIVLTLYILTETPTPNQSTEVVYSPAEVFDSAVGMITDTVLKPRPGEPRLFTN